MSAGTVKVPLRAGSDGDATHRPSNPTYVRQPDTIYLEKVAALWMKDRGQSLPGVSYVLERLPAGYAVYGRPRTKDPSHVDKWLYGHPGRKPFDSPNRFYPHFKHIMANGGSSIGCPCKICGGQGRDRASGASGSGTSPITGSRSGTSSKAASSRSTPGPSATTAAIATNPAMPRGRPKQNGPGMDTSRVDEEGTPDVYRNLINKLKKSNILDEDIHEPLSMDWRVEQEALPKLKAQLATNPKWVPRCGEIVLFVRNFPKENVAISRDRQTGHFKLYDEETKTFVGYPTWEAGYVAQVPSEVEEIRLDDLVDDSGKAWGVTYTGLRVEALPDPNSEDKVLSKRYALVPLHRVRPFAFYKEFLEHLAEDEWHPTIKNALTTMSSFVVLDKHRFQGKWPEAWLYCYGVYLGSELLAVGDAVRLLPKQGSASCTDIMVIKSIRMQFTNLHLASENDYDEGRPYNTSLFVFGKGYTTDQTRSSKQWLDPDERVPAVTRGYGPWHPLQSPEKELMVPFSRLLGRLYEAEAMTLWLPSLTDKDGALSRRNIDQGREGLLEGRAFARTHDKRIVNNFGSTWFWADSRVEALDLHTVNGFEVGKYAADRDPATLRSHAKKLEKASIAEKLAEEKTGAEGQRNLRGFMAPTQTQHANLPVRAGSARLSEERSGSGSGSGVTRTTTAGDSRSGSKKRTKMVIDLSDDEEGGQNKRQVVDKGVMVRKGKAMVVISK